MFQKKKSVHFFDHNSFCDSSDLDKEKIIMKVDVKYNNKFYQNKEKLIDKKILINDIESTIIRNNILRRKQFH